MGDLQFTSTSQTWGAAPSTSPSDTIDINATNIRSAKITVARADVDCNVALNISTDGPITITLPGCNRVVKAG
jgi:hypothetical protein